LNAELGCYGDKAYILGLPAGGGRLPASEETVQKKLHFTQMNGREVFKCAVISMCNCSEEVLAQAGLGIDKVDFLVPHQANQRIIDACAKRLGLPLERVLINLSSYGNTSAATIPLVMEEAFREGKIKNGHQLLLTASGTGFTWGAMLMRWYDYKLKKE
ncbi:MAG TPA: 3-oxoacyl-ACP synthase, partial [Desulfotomaculum sp.]|nr:3-oxoacyl-ACP synthase [Desulfotomaculum sp.]